MKSHRPSLAASAVLVATLLAPGAHAADTTADALQALEARIRTLEHDGEQLRAQAAAALAEAQAARAELERMKGAQASAAASSASAQQAASVAVVSVAAPAAPAPSAGGANGNAFNPAISVILNGVYAHHSLDPDRYVRSGFPVIDGTGPGAQGFSIGESELAFAANIDDKLYGQLTVTAENDRGSTNVGIEEAFIDTTTLPDGFSVRAGRFYSNIGYLNSHHTHTDAFTDRPLAYQAFLGNQYADDGVQLRWVPPLDFFLELGGELYRGQNFPSGGAAHGGVGAHTLFVHAGGDVGDDNSWLAGLSTLKTAARGAADGFSGDDTLYLADLTWKWAPNGNTKDGGVTLRGEYIVDDRSGAFSNVFATLPAATTAFDDAIPDQAWNGKRRGAYVEGVYRINRTWDAGYRYDKLWSDRDGPYATTWDPVRHTVMLTWRNSEFSLVRVQLSHDDPTRDTTDNAIYVQYQVSLGAHGAHKF